MSTHEVQPIQCPELCLQGDAKTKEELLKMKMVCGGLKDNGPHRLIYLNNYAQFVELFEKD